MSKINPYFKYIFNRENTVLLMGAIVSLLAIGFFINRLVNTPIDSPFLAVYLTPMMSLISIWIPIISREHKKYAKPLLPVTNSDISITTPVNNSLTDNINN